MEIYLERCAGMIVSYNKITIMIIVGKENEETFISKTFRTVHSEFDACIQLLQEYNIEHIALSMKGDYWQPLCDILHPLYEVTLVDPYRIKRMTVLHDKRPDIEWVANLHRLGLIPITEITPQTTREQDELRERKKRLLQYVGEEIAFMNEIFQSTSIDVHTFIEEEYGEKDRSILEKIEKQRVIGAVKKAGDGKHKKFVERSEECLFSSLSEVQRFQLVQAWKHIVELESMLCEIDEQI